MVEQNQTEEQTDLIRPKFFGKVTQTHESKSANVVYSKVPDIDDGYVGTTMERKELSRGDVRDASRHFFLFNEKGKNASHHLYSFLPSPKRRRTFLKRCYQF